MYPPIPFPCYAPIGHQVNTYDGVWISLPRVLKTKSSLNNIKLLDPSTVKKFLATCLTSSQLKSTFYTKFSLNLSSNRQKESLCLKKTEN